MRQIVLDASCMTALLLNEDVPPSLGGVFDTLMEIELVVPSLWYWEVANSTLSAARRANLDVGVIADQLRDARRLRIAPDHDAIAQAWGTTISLAAANRLTVYDATYLEIALRRGLSLATLDTALARAARAEGVEVIGG